MQPQDLQRTAYTVECFLNALQLDDTPERTELEETLVRWLVDGARLKEDHLIYQQGAVSCYSRGHVTEYFEVPLARQEKILWCNGAKLSAIDGPAFSQNAQLVMLGLGGLVLGMPGVSAAATAKDKQRSSSSSSSNNNNNNG
ncbi:MAG: hypothetical protein V4858_28740 [Pseudomonadota bacterium]